jgi:hypothetical protein
MKQFGWDPLVAPLYFTVNGVDSDNLIFARLAFYFLRHSIALFKLFVCTEFICAGTVNERMGV